MAIRFVREALKPADILAGRNIEGRIAQGIRDLLGSYTNHNALILRHNTMGLCVGDTMPPEAAVVDLEYYEEKVNAGLYVVRIWRVRNMAADERLHVSRYWQIYCDHQPYPSVNLCRLWVFRAINHLPWEIRGRWCTKNTLIPFELVLPADRDPRRRPDGKVKKNPTPRTMENRLVAGVLEDVTPQVIEEV